MLINKSTKRKGILEYIRNIEADQNAYVIESAHRI